MKDPQERLAKVTQVYPYLKHDPSKGSISQRSFSRDKIQHSFDKLVNKKKTKMLPPTKPQ